MKLEEFKRSLEHNSPPSVVTLALKALWYDARGDWATAHLLAQEEDDFTGSWVHGYLHRKEGDLSNAEYWYSRAGRRLPVQSLEEEWEEIAKALLSKKL